MLSEVFWWCGDGFSTPNATDWVGFPAREPLPLKKTKKETNKKIHAFQNCVHNGKLVVLPTISTYSFLHSSINSF